MDRRSWPWGVRVCLFALLGLILLAGVPRSAWAHAILMESTPEPNSTVKGPEIAISLRFNVRVDASRSRLRLIAPDASVVVLSIANHASPDLLQSTVNGLKPGAYAVVWQVLASDGHMSHGKFPFNVN